MLTLFTDNFRSYTFLFFIYPYFIKSVPDNSPRVGSSRVAQVVIRKNDNANGVVQLSSNAVSVHEPHSGTIVNLIRTAGDFGTVSEIST